MGKTKSWKFCFDTVGICVPQKVQLILYFLLWLEDLACIFWSKAWFRNHEFCGKLSRWIHSFECENLCIENQNGMKIAEPSITCIFGKIPHFVCISLYKHSDPKNSKMDFYYEGFINHLWNKIKSDIALLLVFARVRRVRETKSLTIEQRKRFRHCKL